MSIISCSKSNKNKQVNFQFIISTQRFGCSEIKNGFCINDYVEINNDSIVKIAISKNNFNEYDYFTYKVNKVDYQLLINLINDTIAFNLSQKDESKSTKTYCGYVYKLEDISNEDRKFVFFDPIKSNNVHEKIIYLYDKIIQSEQKEKCEPFNLKLDLENSEQELRKNWAEPPIKSKIKFDPTKKS